MREAVEQVRSPLATAYLAATLGQLGRTEDAGEALARYRERADMPIEDVAFRAGAEHIEAFARGVAVAAGALANQPEAGG